MLLDLNFKFKDVKGNELRKAVINEESFKKDYPELYTKYLIQIESDKASDTVANILASKMDGFKAVKAFDMAIRLSKDGVIEIDKPDLDILKSALENNTNMFNFALAQILEAIKNCEQN